MSTKEQRTERTSFSLFQEAWWLELVAPGEWSEVVVEAGGQIVGRLPYVRHSKWGMTFLTMPPLTQVLGPWLLVGTGKDSKRLGQEKKRLGKLIERLPECDVFSQNFHYSMENWLPFYWKGFRQTTRYTYLIEDLSDLDTVWGGTLEKVRTDVRKAEKALVVRDDLEIDEFLRINAMTYQRLGKSMPYSNELVRRIDRACGEKGNRRIFSAIDANERIHAVAYLVWDEDSAHYLMGGADPDLRSSGAGSLVLWAAIKFAATVTRRFDFEGSMIEPVERFFRAYGGKLVPYSRVWRYSPRMRRLRAGRNLLNLFTGRESD